MGSGKHVFTEKPLTVDPEDGAVLVRRAAESGLLLGAAPDTFLGGGGQRARQLLDDGAIGAPIACTAFVRSTRPELWHPNPGFLFQPGGGQVLDLGPYYLTMLVNLLGPIRSVSAVAGPTGGTRQLSAPDRVVDAVKVEVSTHVSASLTFANRVVGTMAASFDIWETELPYLEIYGDEGTMILGNPDIYDWPVRIRRRGASSWQDHAPRQNGVLSRRSEDS
jgi:predicted dehydrogenase